VERKTQFPCSVKENLRKKNAGARPVSSPDAETAALEKQARDWRKQVNAALQKEAREHRLETTRIRIEEQKREIKLQEKEIERL
jgi:hypothetical protein